MNSEEPLIKLIRTCANGKGLLSKDSPMGRYCPFHSPSNDCIYKGSDIQIPKNPEPPSYELFIPGYVCNAKKN